MVINKLIKIMQSFNFSSSEEKLNYIKQMYPIFYQRTRQFILFNRYVDSSIEKKWGKDSIDSILALNIFNTLIWEDLTNYVFNTDPLLFSLAIQYKNMYSLYISGIDSIRSLYSHEYIFSLLTFLETIEKNEL